MLFEIVRSRESRRWAAMVAAVALGGGGLGVGAGCGGGNRVEDVFPTPSPSPTPTPPADPVPGFTGNYGALIAMNDTRFAVLTLSVLDGAGTARGNVYVYLEDQPALRGRHSGNHTILASGPVSGQVDRETRTLQLSGVLTDLDAAAAQTSLAVGGTLMRPGTDFGSVVLDIGPDRYTGVFQ